MPNTSLPSPVAVDAPDHNVHHGIIHTEINDLSRDTGWRDVTTLLINGWTATYVHVRRIRDRTYLRFKGLNGAASSSQRIFDFTGGIGTGFSPPDVMESGTYRNSSSAFTPYFTCSLSGGLSTTALANFGTATAREWNWPCVATWPTALPGTATT